MVTANTCCVLLTGVSVVTWQVLQRCWQVLPWSGGCIYCLRHYEALNVSEHWTSLAAGTARPCWPKDCHYDCRQQDGPSTSKICAAWWCSAFCWWV